MRSLERWESPYTLHATVKTPLSECLEVGIFQLLAHVLNLRCVASSASYSFHMEWVHIANLPTWLPILHCAMPTKWFQISSWPAACVAALNSIYFHSVCCRSALVPTYRKNTSASRLSWWIDIVWRQVLLNSSAHGYAQLLVFPCRTVF